MHDAEIASRQEAVMKGRWKRLIQAKPERENKRDGRGIEGKKTTKSKKNPLSREYGICTSFSSYSAVMSCWHMCDLAVFGKPQFHITTQPMHPFFFFGSSSSLSKSGTRGVGLCGVVMSFSDVELVVGKIGRVAMVGVMR
jgi:hypothetical protein